MQTHNSTNTYVHMYQCTTMNKGMEQSTVLLLYHPLAILVLHLLDL